MLFQVGIKLHNVEAIPRQRNVAFAAFETT